MQDEGLLAVGLHQTCQVWLLNSGVDVRVAVVLEHAEKAVQPDVDAGRLDELRGVGVELHPPGTDLGLDVTIREEHASNLPGPVRCLREYSEDSSLRRESGLARGCSSMAEHQLPKLTVRVRF